VHCYTGSVRLELASNDRDARVIAIFTRLRFASTRHLAIGAMLPFVAAIVLDRTTPRGPGDFFVAVLFGMAIGLGMVALVRWRARIR